MRQFKSLMGYSEEKVHDDTVPDIFIACLREADFKIFEVLDIDLDRLLHTTQTFDFMKTIFVGDEIVTRPAVTKVRTKLNSANPFVTLEITTEYFRNEELIARTSGTIFVREALS